MQRTVRTWNLLTNHKVEHTRISEDPKETEFQKMKSKLSQKRPKQRAKSLLFLDDSCLNGKNSLVLTITKIISSDKLTRTRKNPKESVPKRWILEKSAKRTWQLVIAAEKRVDCIACKQTTSMVSSIGGGGRCCPSIAHCLVLAKLWFQINRGRHRPN